MLPRTPLLTDRLLLRPYEQADAAQFFAVLDQSRARLQHSFSDRLRAVPTLAATPAQLAAFATDWRTGRFYVLGIWQRDTLDYLGDICLMPQQDGQAEIGYYLAAQAEGQGYAREALAAICRFGFEQVGAQRLLIRCFADNERAQAVARASGFITKALVPAPVVAGKAWFSWWSGAARSPEILHFIRKYSELT